MSKPLQNFGSLPMSTRNILLFSFVSLLILLSLSPSFSKDQNDKIKPVNEEDDEDLSFLEADDDQKDTSHLQYPDSDQFDDEDGPDSDDFDNFGDFDGSDTDQYKQPEVDEKDVVVLKEGNFSDFIDKNKFVMVEFYAPWCGHCQALAPEYAAAATELKGENVVLAKVDATEENELSQEYDVQGFPTVHFFIDGVHKPYTGQRTKDAIVTWIKKKTGPGIYNVTTLDDAERILSSESKVVLGYLNSLVGPENEELAAVSRLEDDINFYQTANPDVAKLFHIDPKVKRPALVLVKREAEKLSYFDGQFVKSEITEFVFANKLPLVTTFTRENAPSIFESPIKKQLLLFATSNNSEKVMSVFQEAAKVFKGKTSSTVSLWNSFRLNMCRVYLPLFPNIDANPRQLIYKLIFVYVEMDNEDVGKPVSDYFGISGDGPKVLAYTGNEDGKKFVFEKEVTLDNLKAFGGDFIEDKLKPFYKSDPIPETNDGDVKIIVGNNFDEIVLDESKDVLLEIYAPWCGHCQSLEPTYNKLAKHLHGIESLVVAKMDGTTNEHPRAKADGFPTLLFFPAGNKSFDPITVDADRTVVAFYKFLKKHASIPFKLEKPASTTKPESSDVKEASDSSFDDVKDEL